MFFKEQPGKRVIKVCTSISCYLRGCDQLMEHLENRLGIKRGETTPDGRYTLQTAECLASCGTAPVLQVNNEFVERVTPESADALIDALNQDLDNQGTGKSQSQPQPAVPEKNRTEAAGTKRH
jgi:NADH:ubiquinone oxidoreductase subunit E